MFFQRGLFLVLLLDGFSDQEHLFWLSIETMSSVLTA